MSDAQALGKRIIREEAEALVALAGAIGPAFDQAVAALLDLGDHGQTIVSGIGKSGLIGRKIAATLSSTGTAAVFLHPVEGLHGDLGVVGRSDALIALSKSGQTEELVRFAAHFKRVGGPMIAVCESAESGLGELADVTLLLPRCDEAGPLALAPTTSTTMMLALGDALAMALLQARGFKEEDFARFHPEGALGRRLLLRAEDVMHRGGDMPIVKADATFRELLAEMTNKHLGCALLVESDRRLFGVFTEGDLRRLLERSDRPMSLAAREAWRLSRRDPTEPPVPVSFVPPHTLAVECLEIMRASQITGLVIASPDRVPLGFLRLQDLVKAGLS